MSEIGDKKIHSLHLRGGLGRFRFRYFNPFFFTFFYSNSSFFLLRFLLFLSFFLSFFIFYLSFTFLFFLFFSFVFFFFYFFRSFLSFIPFFFLSWSSTPFFLFYKWIPSTLDLGSFLQIITSYFLFTRKSLVKCVLLNFIEEFLNKLMGTSNRKFYKEIASNLDMGLFSFYASFL